MQVQETEYKTVEEEVTRFKCDSCGHVGEDDEMYELQVQGLDKRRGRLHQCEECSELDQPVSLAKLLLSDEYEAKLEKFGEFLSWPLALSIMVAPPVMGVAGWLIGGTSLGPAFWFMVAAYIMNFVLVMGFVAGMAALGIEPE